MAVSGGNTWKYSYDNKNELTQAQHWQSDPRVYGTGDTLLEEVDYKYDVWGNLVETDSYPTGSGSPNVTRYAVDGWNPALKGATGNANFNVWADLDGSNNLLTRYFHGDQVDQLLGRQDSGTQYWYVTDNLGSVRDVLDNSGNVKDAITYDGWGNIISETNSAYRGNYAWTGRMLDVETGLQYNRARWYDSRTGRWQTQDPLGFDAGDSNLYRYATNNPVSNSDASGLQFLTGSGAGVGNGQGQASGAAPIQGYGSPQGGFGASGGFGGSGLGTLGGFGAGGGLGGLNGNKGPGMPQVPPPPAPVVPPPPAPAPAPTANIIISPTQNAFGGWPEGHFANANSWGFGISINVVTSTPIKNWTITQQVLAVKLMVIDNTTFYSVVNKANPNPRLPGFIDQKQYDDFVNDIKQSQAAGSPQGGITLAPDGPNYINENPPKPWFQWAPNSLTYWDFPGTAGTINGVRFTGGEPANNKNKGETIISSFFITVTATSGATSKTASYANVNSIFFSDGTNWK